MYDHSAQMAAYAIKKASRESAAMQLRQENPHLVPGLGYAIAAKNMRIELKRAFPGITFRVNSKSYSGGNSVRVTWIDGPTTSQVECIINRYSQGNFDGMTDSYTYSDDRTWNDAFGSTKYVFANRDYSDRVLASVIVRVCRDYGADIPHNPGELWRAGKLWQLRNANGSDVARAISQALAKHTCSVTR